MPANKSFLDPVMGPLVSGFLKLINEPSRIPAERDLDELTDQLEGTMEVMGEMHPIREMKLPAEEANFLALLVRQLGRQHDRPLKAIDIGTFTGRSALAMANAIQTALPHGGSVISCDIDDKYKELAETHWQKAGVRNLIDYRIGDAKKTLQDLLYKKEKNTFDLIFIDADKTGYEEYYEKALKLVRPGGLIVLDNMLWSGHVAKNAYYEHGHYDEKGKETYDASAEALRALNLKISEDKRVERVLLGFEDGVMVIEKKDPQLFAKMSMPLGNQIGVAECRRPYDADA